jgi:hypothetical protein
LAEPSLRNTGLDQWLGLVRIGIYLTFMIFLQ